VERLLEVLRGPGGLKHPILAEIDGGFRVVLAVIAPLLALRRVGGQWPRRLGWLGFKHQRDRCGRAGQRIASWSF